VRTHKPEIVEGSVQRQVLTHGVSFMIRCCGEHEVSVHIQNIQRFSKDDLARLHEDYLAEVAEAHEGVLTAEEYFASLSGVTKESCGCEP
jgi:hypothetical protein